MSLCRNYDRHFEYRGLCWEDSPVTGWRVGSLNDKDPPAPTPEPQSVVLTQNLVCSFAFGTELISEEYGVVVRPLH